MLLMPDSDHTMSSLSLQSRLAILLSQLYQKIASYWIFSFFLFLHQSLCTVEESVWENPSRAGVFSDHPV